MYPIPPWEHLVEERVCKCCGAKYPITDKDMEFYEKVSPSFPSWGVPTIGGGVVAPKKYLIPPPTLCPDCRQQRRLAFRNERKLYKRKCDATGKDIVSIYSPDKPYTVYHQDYWWSDKWDPMSYGREYDFERSAMEQLWELMRQVPKLALSVEKQENSEYTNYAGWNKDCYLIFLGANNENCHYCSGVWDSKNTLDCNNSQRVSESYGLVDCSGCYNSTHLQNSQNCRDCHYGLNLINCGKCLFCINLHGQEYYILNKKVSKEQYEHIISDKSLFLKIKNEYEILKWNEPRKENSNVNTENTLGNNLSNSHNIFSSFDVVDSKDCKYVGWMFQSKDCYDVYDWWSTAERCYECHKVWDGASSVFFSAFCLSQVESLYYCYDCTNNTSHCLLCTWLRNKSYCILNKQYTKEEYESLVPRIIEKMIVTPLRGGFEGQMEWWEFFPASMSPFGYNETVANEYYPMSREEVLGNLLEKGGGSAKGGTGGLVLWNNENKELQSSVTSWQLLSQGAPNQTFLHWPLFNWSDYEAPFPKVEKIIPASKLPESIESIPDDILNWAIECEVSKKLFRIIKQELDFYRKHSLPIPRRHPDVRHMDRMKMRNPRKLYERLCDCERCEENNRNKGIILKEREDAGYRTEQNPQSPRSSSTAPLQRSLQKKILTTYSPERQERVYCEVCYEKEV